VKKILVEINSNPYAYPFQKREKLDENDESCHVCNPWICGIEKCSFYQLMCNPNVIKELNREYSKKILDIIPVKKCRSCNSDLDDSKVMVYQHENGWDLHTFGFGKKQWIYIKCPVCQNEITIWKLGVPRDFIFE